MSKEYKYIDYLSKYLGKDKKLILGPGDDCAVLKISDKFLVLTVDEIVENTHFLMSFSTPELLALKLTRASVSDIYAMGNCKPVCCLVSAGLKKDLDESWFKRFVKALKKECRNYDMPLAGGNMARSENLHFAMTVIGIATGKIIKRKGAKENELVYAIGKMGNSKAGLELLLSQKLKYSSLEKSLMDSFWKPEIFKKEAVIISEFATSMLDNSDGLYKSLEIISNQNNLKVIVEINENFASKSLLNWAMKNNKDWREYVLKGGEDYNLIFTIKPSDKEKLEKKLPFVYQIGHTEKGKGVFIKNYNGKIESFEHF